MQIKTRLMLYLLGSCSLCSAVWIYHAWFLNVPVTWKCGYYASYYNISLCGLILHSHDCHLTYKLRWERLCLLCSWAASRARAAEAVWFYFCGSNVRLLLTSPLKSEWVTLWQSCHKSSLSCLASWRIDPSQWRQSCLPLEPRSFLSTERRSCLCDLPLTATHTSCWIREESGKKKPHQINSEGSTSCNTVQDIFMLICQL